MQVNVFLMSEKASVTSDTNVIETKHGQMLSVGMSVSPGKVCAIALKYFFPVVSPVSMLAICIYL